VAAALGNLLLASLYGLHAATGVLPLADPQNRVLRETHGFRDLAELAAGLEGRIYADRYQETAMLRFYSPGIQATQWPGLSRPSEYLRGRIAPRVDSGAIKGPFWLLNRGQAAPEIPGMRMTARRALVDCPRMPLVETDEPPCARPLHRWILYAYRPEAP
jgi:hypothetical protein